MPEQHIQPDYEDNDIYKTAGTSRLILLNHSCRPI